MNVIPYVIGQHVKQSPEKVAVIFADYKQSLTYETLDRHVQAMASWLAHQGITTGAAVGVLAKDARKTSLMYLACAYLGAKAVALDPDAGLDIIKKAQATIGFKLVVCHAKFAYLLDALSVQIIRLEDKEGIVDLPAYALPYLGERLRVEFEPTTDIILLNTSGSTGKPKVVRIHQQGVVANAQAVGKFLTVTDKDRFLSLTPTTHAHGFYNGLLMPLVLGASTVMIDGMSVFHVPRFWAMVREYQVSIINIVPTIIEMLVDLKSIPPEPMPCMRFCLCGTAPLKEERRIVFEKTMGVKVICQYGLTETLINSIEPPQGPRVEGSVGQPVGSHIELINGEIVIGGPSVTNGYEQELLLSQEVIKNGKFMTGDLGRLDANGFLHIIGRKKDLIIKGGKNIIPSDIEHVLLQHPSVKDAAVVGLPDPFFGEEIYAAIILNGPQDLDNILVFCRERLPNVGLPKALLVVDQLPKGPTGKLQKNLIRDICLQQLSLKEGSC